MKFCLSKNKWQSGIKTTFSQLLIAMVLPSIAYSDSAIKIHPALINAGSTNQNIRQDIIVTGKVTDANGLGLPGVSVKEKGTKASATTDINGNFKIAVSGNNATLIFSYIGFEAQTITLDGRMSINVSLKESVNLLSDVVVVGYGTSKRSDLTGAISSINMKDVKSLPVPDAGQAIQGRASGVQVIAPGAPGSNVTIRVRGTNTIGNSDPLIVIDGVPSGLPLNAINPDDIASMDILKDASALAIYGSQSAGGVLLITTKKGAAGKGHLDFKAYAATEKATSMPEMLNSQQFAALHNEMMANNNQALNPAYADPSSITTNTDWLGILFQTAALQNYSLSYSGGSEKSTYYVSGGYTDKEGIVINNRYKRYNVQFNTDNKVFNWLRFTNNLTFSHDKKTSGSINIRNAMSALPVQPLTNPDGSWSGPDGQSSWYGDVRNPIGEALVNSNRTLGYNVLGNIAGEFTIVKQLKFKTTGGLQAAFWDDRNWSPKYDWKPIKNEFSVLSQSYNKKLAYLWDNYFTYDATFNTKHHLTLMGGASMQDSKYSNISASKSDFISDGAAELNNGTVNEPSGGLSNQWRMFSLLSRVNYSYANKYLLTANFRRDASSRFGPNNKWASFPSASVKWRLSEESFFKKGKVVGDLSIRAGYGITGNQEIGLNDYLAKLFTGMAVFNGQIVTTVIPLVMPNADLKWEGVEQGNIGVDATFLNGRITLTADAYIKNTNDMLVPMAVPVTTGYSDQLVPAINLGKVSNKGLEFAVTSQNIKGIFDWSTNFNFSYNHNEVLNLNGDVPLFGGNVASQNTNVQKVGLPINSFYGVIANGIFQTQEEVNNYAKQHQGNDIYNSTAPGDIKFRDINNDGQINDADRTYLGNPNPRFTFAMNNTFGYKGFDLSVFLQGVEGNDILNANRIFQEGMAVAQNQTTTVLNRWAGPGTSNTMPRAVFNDPNKNTRPSSRFIEDGSYLRVKNITIGYTLPKSLLGKMKVASARFYLSGQNLITFTNYSGIDPEVGVNGIDLGTYPVTRTLSAGINVGF